MKHKLLRQILQFTSSALVCAALLTSTSLPTLPASGGTEIRQETDGAGNKNGSIEDGTEEGEPSTPETPGKGKGLSDKPEIRPQNDDDDDIDCCAN